MAELKDRLGRILNYVRISITDRCNFRCRYCMPEDGVSWVPHDEILSFEEITHLCDVLVEMGVKKIRFTGGEPLVRKGTADFLVSLRDEFEKLSIALTTNAFFLKKNALLLKRARLTSVNISLDTLNREKFKAVSRFDALDDVIDGIRFASNQNIAPLKINTVLIRGFNEDEIHALLAFSKEVNAQLRLIEFMPVGRDLWSDDSFVSATEILASLSCHGDWQKETRVNDETAGPAAHYTCEKTGDRIGIISAVSHHFCDSCNRLRISATGKVRNCLFSDKEKSLKEALVVNDKDKVREIILSSIEEKSRCWQEDKNESLRMSSIGG